MKRSLAVAVSSLLLIAILRPGVAHASSAFEGQWVTSDWDTSTMTLTVTARGPRGAFSVQLFDDGATVCGWDQANPSPGFSFIAWGTARSISDTETMLLRWTRAVCEDGTRIRLQPQVATFTYDSGSDTLWDGYFTWTRAG